MAHFTLDQAPDQPRHFTLDPSDQSDGFLKQASDATGDYAKAIEDSTGIPADISSQFVKGATLNYVDAGIETPEDAGFGHKAASTTSYLLGMGLGVLPAGWTAKAGLGLLGVGGAIAETATTGALYGATRKKETGESRLENAAKDAFVFGTAAAAGAGLTKAAAKFSKPVKETLEAVAAGSVLTPKQKVIQKTLEYTTASLTGTGFAGSDLIQKGETDPGKIGQELALGAVTFGLTHGLSSKAKEIKDAVKKNRKIVTQADADVLQKTKDFLDAEETKVPPKGEDAVKVQILQEKEQQAQTLHQTALRANELSGNIGRLKQEILVATSSGVDPEVLKAMSTRLKNLSEAFSATQVLIAQQRNVPRGATESVPTQPAGWERAQGKNDEFNPQVHTDWTEGLQPSEAALRVREKLDAAALEREQRLNGETIDTQPAGRMPTTLEALEDFRGWLNQRSDRSDKLAKLGEGTGYDAEDVERVMENLRFERMPTDGLDKQWEIAKKILDAAETYADFRFQSKEQSHTARMLESGKFLTPEIEAEIARISGGDDRLLRQAQSKRSEEVIGQLAEKRIAEIEQSGKSLSPQDRLLVKEQVRSEFEAEVPFDGPSLFDSSHDVEREPRQFDSGTSQERKNINLVSGQLSAPLVETRASDGKPFLKDAPADEGVKFRSDPKHWTIANAETSSGEKMYDPAKEAEKEFWSAAKKRKAEKSVPLEARNQKAIDDLYGDRLTKSTSYEQNPVLPREIKESKAGKLVESRLKPLAEKITAKIKADLNYPIDRKIFFDAQKELYRLLGEADRRTKIPGEKGLTQARTDSFKQFEKEAKKVVGEALKKVETSHHYDHLIETLDAGAERKLGMSYRRLETLTAADQAWINRWLKKGGLWAFTENRADTLAEAEKFLKLKFVDAGNESDQELAATLSYLAGNKGVLPEGTTVLVGHGEGAGDSWRFVGSKETIKEVIARNLRPGESAYVIACDDLIKRNYSLAAGTWVKNVLKEAKAETPPEKDTTSPIDIPPIKPKALPDKDAFQMTTMLLQPLHVADRFPALEPVMQAFIDAGQRHVHETNKDGSALREILWEAEKLLGGRDIKRSFYEKLFAPHDKTLNSIVKSNWNKWVREETPAPEEIKPLIDKWRTLFKRYHAEVVQRKIGRLLADVKAPIELPGSREGARLYVRDKNNNIVHGDNVRIIELLNAISDKKIDLSGNPLDWVAKNREALGESIKRVAESTGVEQNGFSKGELHQAQDILSDIEDIKGWGQDPMHYIAESFNGPFKVINDEGKVVGSGSTAKSATASFLRNRYGSDLDFSKPIEAGAVRSAVLTNPRLTSTLHQLLQARADYRPDKEVFGEEGSVAAINFAREKYGRASFFAAADSAARTMEKSMDRAIQDAENAFGLRLQKVDFRDSGKWFGSLLKKSTNLSGEFDDPMTNGLKYLSGMQKKWAVDDLAGQVKTFLKDFPLDQKNLRDLLEQKLQAFSGEYSAFDRELDSIRVNMAEFLEGKMGVKNADFLRGEGALLTRATNKMSTFTDVMTLGWAPVKVAMNRYGGFTRTWIKTSLPDMIAGKNFLRTKEGAAFVDAHAHTLGIDALFSNESGEAISKWKKLEVLRPLHGYQSIEVVNRKEAFAIGYVKALKELPPSATKEIEAIAFAKKLVQLTQGVYGAAARPGLLHGSKLSGPLLTLSYKYKQFLSNEVRLMASLTPAEWAKYIPSMLAVGGTRGAILIGKSFAAAPVISSVLSLAGLGALLDSLNERLNIAYPRLHRGLPGLFNLDLSAAATWQLPSSMNEYLGKPISDLIATADTLKQKMGPGLTDTEWADYQRQIFPVAYSIHKGFQILTEGKIMKGTRLQQNVPNKFEAVANFAGARSARESAQSDTLNWGNKETRDEQEKFRVFLDDLAGASPMQAGALVNKAVKDGIISQDVSARIMASYKNRNLPTVLQMYMKASPNVKMKLQKFGYIPGEEM